MKKILLILFCFCISSFALEINFEKTLSDAKTKALKQNKKLMIMYSSPTCPECAYMKKKVLKNKEIASFVNENFVSVIMNIREDKKELPYKFIGIPTFFFVDASNMKVLSKRIGGTRENKFLEIIKAVK